MAKLRVVKPRSLDRGHEADLRGLGNDPILSGIQPQAVLTIACEKAEAEKIVSEVKAHLSEFDAIHEKHGVHILKRNNTEDFKLDSVDLMTFWLYVKNQKLQGADVCAQLWLTNPLRAHLLRSNSENVDTPLISIEGSIWDSAMKVEYPVTAFLRQAGFAITHTQYQLSLSNSDLDRLYFDLKDDLKSANSTSTRRVG